jgi:hypothetical protein
VMLLVRWRLSRLWDGLLCWAEFWLHSCKLATNFFGDQSFVLPSTLYMYLYRPFVAHVFFNPNSIPFVFYRSSFPITFLSSFCLFLLLFRLCFLSTTASMY